MTYGRAAALLLLAAALAVAGCGTNRPDSAPNQAAKLLLDGPPGAVHTGLYTAVARGYDDALGVQLTIRAPSARTDGAQELASDRVRLAVLGIVDLAKARERGLDLVGVMAIVQRARRPIPGTPPYPALVLCASRVTLQDEPGVVRAALSAIARGYTEVIADPESGASNLLDATAGLDRAKVTRDLDAVSGDFTAGARVFGQLDVRGLRAWARWAQRRGIIRRIPDVTRMFDGRYVPRSGSRD